METPEHEKKHHKAFYAISDDMPVTFESLLSSITNIIYEKKRFSAAISITGAG
jgi:hypothetical protein